MLLFYIVLYHIKSLYTNKNSSTKFKTELQNTVLKKQEQALAAKEELKDLGDAEYKHIGFDPENYEKEIKETEDYFDELYDENSQKKISAYKELIASNVKLDETQQQDYESLITLQNVYLIHCYRVQQTEAAYKALNAEQQKSILLDKLNWQTSTKKGIDTDTLAGTSKALKNMLFKKLPQIKIHCLQVNP